MMIRGGWERRKYLDALGLDKPVNIKSALASKPGRVLIVGMKRIGDLIVALPAMQSLREHFPHASLTIMSALDHMPLLKGQFRFENFEPLVEDVASFKQKAAHYDLIISVRKWNVIPNDLTSFPPLYQFSTALFLGPPKPAHVHYLDALKMLGLKSPVRRPRLKLDSEAKAYAKRLFNAFSFGPGEIVVAIHPGGSYPAKRWHADRCARVLNWLKRCYDAKFIIVRGRDDISLSASVTALLEEERFALLGEVPLPHLAAVLARSTFFLGNDSGIMHLADAVDLPTLTVFGPSRPGVWGAAGPNSVYIVREDMWHNCPVCSGRHLKDIPCMRPREPACLEAIRTDDVLAGIESLAALVRLRDRFKHLDRIEITKNLLCAPIGSKGLVLANLKHMKPLFVWSERERVLECIDALENSGSYSQIAQMLPESRTILDALLACRILLPANDDEELLNGRRSEAARNLLTHSLMADLDLHLNSCRLPSAELSESFGASRPTLRSSSDRKKLRILFVNSVHPSVYGGGERWMIRVGRALMGRGHEVLCWGFPNHRWLADARQQELICLSRPLPSGLDLTGAAELVDFLRRLKPDAALLNLDRDVVALGLPLKVANTPVVFARKGLPGIDLEPVTRWAYCKVLSGIITPSRTIAQEIINEGWLGPGRIRVIPNGVEVSQFEAPVSGLWALRTDLDINEEDMVILTVGRMTPQKGFHYLLRAMPSILIKFPRAILILVGAGSAERDLHRETEKLGIRGALRFAGERWDTRNLLAIADCYVQPSLYEGMSTAILEAMAAGVPVVASAVYGAVEAITDQVTGLLVPPAKPAALAKAVCRILEQGGIGPQLAKAGLEHVGLHYSFEVMVDSVEELLRFGISSV